MKKLMILLPALALLMVAGLAFSKPEPAEKEPSYKHRFVWESFPRSGLRLGVVLSDNESKRGVRVERVTSDGPAARGGLKEGDLILKLDGTRVSAPRDVREFLKNLEEEKEIQVEIERDGKPLTIQITPEKREHFRMVLGGRLFLGLSLQELDSDLASYFQVDPGAGVLVTRVETESPAAKAGIRSGDVITHVDGEKINRTGDILRKLENADEGQTLEITLMRHGAEKKMTVKPEEMEWQHPAIPPVPEIRNMLRDNPAFRENMEDFRLEMDQMREDLQQLREEIQEEIQREMKKLKQELKDFKNET